MFKCKKNLYNIATKLNAKEMITNLVAFFPPKNIQYKLIPIEGEKERLLSGEIFDIKYQKFKFIHENFSEISFPWIKTESYKIERMKKKSKTKDKNTKSKGINGKQIAVLIIRNKNARHNIIFSHGNSSDLATMYPFLIDLSTQFKANIISYDYQGYGESQGKSSENNLYLDIENVLEFCKYKRSLNITPSISNTDPGNNNRNSFILIGHSLGSAPSVHIASMTSSSNNLIRTLILISPIASGIKFFEENSTNNIGLEKKDVFCNIKKIIEVKTPVFLIHGMKDELIPVKHSQEMLKYVKTKYEWFPKNGSHGNILTKYRTKFFVKCNLFLDNLFCFERKETNNTVISRDVSLNLSFGQIKSNCNNNLYAEMSVDKRGSYVCYQNPLNFNYKKSTKYENDLDYNIEKNNSNSDINTDENIISSGILNEINNEDFMNNKQNISNIEKLNVEDEIDLNFINENMKNDLQTSKGSYESLKYLDFNENKYLKNSYSFEKSNILIFGKDYSTNYDNNKERHSLNSEFNYMKEIENPNNDDYENPFK